EQKGVRRSPEREVEPVDLEAGRTAHHEAAVADRPLRHTVENPRCARVGAPCLALARQGAVEALRRRAAAAKPPGRMTSVTPEAADLAGGGVVVLAGRTAPRAGAAPSAADLDRMRAGRVDRSHPVEAVPTQVHEAAACPEIAH